MKYLTQTVLVFLLVVAVGGELLAAAPCSQLQPSAPLETECVWGANNRTTVGEYLQMGGRSPKQRCYGNYPGEDCK